MTQFTNIEQSQKTLLDYVFPSTLRISNDLKQLVLDYVHPRYVCDFDNNREKCWIRLGVVKYEGKPVFYEICVYDEKDKRGLSSFSLDYCREAISCYYSMCWGMKYLKSLKDWNQIFNEGSYQKEHGKSPLYWVFGRYVFNSHTQRTHLLRCYSKPEQESTKIFIFDDINDEKPAIKTITCEKRQTAFDLIIRICQHVQLYDKSMISHIDSSLSEFVPSPMQLDEMH
jgi:hypothetical protein